MDKNINMNPKLVKFLEENREMSVLGFAWALYWRLALVIFGVAFVIGLLSSVK
jgi:hypothetical protein